MEQFSTDIELFIKDYVRQLTDGTAAVFAGAGFSRGAGLVDWKELLANVAAELKLDLTIENDLIAVAQYHVNARKGSQGLAKAIIDQLSEQAEETESHRILARLPVATWWTTNYDNLIEHALEKAFRIPDVKHDPEQLSDTKPRRAAVVYKMHGDVTFPKKAILYKAQYERYYRTHEPFITALQGDLTTKTFLFVGFSFTDPNLDYVLSRLPHGPARQHYSFVKKVDRREFSDEAKFDYAVRREGMRNDDLQRYGIKTLEVDSFDEIPRILEAVERRYRMKTVFISGSAEEYGDWEKSEAEQFLHELSGALISKGFRVVTGFGWGVGSAVINGALQAIYAKPGKYSEDQLVMRPFPQVATGGVDRDMIWKEYRERMIGLAGSAIFVFGNKRPDKDVVNAPGVRTEFEIAEALSVVTIPVGTTRYMAGELADDVTAGRGHGTALPELMASITEAGRDSKRLVRILVDYLEALTK